MHFFPKSFQRKKQKPQKLGRPVYPSVDDNSDAVHLDIASKWRLPHLIIIVATVEIGFKMNETTILTMLNMKSKVLMTPMMTMSNMRWEQGNWLEMEEAASPSRYDFCRSF